MRKREIHVDKRYISFFLLLLLFLASAVHHLHPYVHIYESDNEHNHSHQSADSQDTQHECELCSYVFSLFIIDEFDFHIALEQPYCILLENIILSEEETTIFHIAARAPPIYPTTYKM